MKFPLYCGLVLLLVPLHTTVLPHIALWGVAPDVGLVVAVLIGLLAGELEGLLVGLAIGWLLNIYSAGELWLSLLTKGGAGLLAGVFGRQVAHVTPTVLCIGLVTLSLLESLLAIATMKTVTLGGSWWIIRSIALPQACLDALLGIGLFWIASQRVVIDRFRALAG